MLLKLALVLFPIAALGGVALAVMRIKTAQNPPMPFALVHGGVAAGGMVLFIASLIMYGASGKILIPLVIFVIAAAGGFAMFAMHLKKKIFPVPLALIHGGAAVIAFLLLLAIVYGKL